MKIQIDNLENQNFCATFQQFFLKLLSTICNKHINNIYNEEQQQQYENLQQYNNQESQLNNLSELLSSILYNFCKELQNETRNFCTFDLIQKSCDSILNKLELINYCKWNRIDNKNYKNVYYKLLKRKLDPTYKRTTYDCNQDLKNIFRKIQRNVNIWAHHVSYDDYDVDKPYNEPPQIQIIRFDVTGDVIITGGSEGIIKLWDVHTCKSIMTLKKHSGAISNLDVHPTNSFIVSCCEGGEVWLWEISFNFYRPHRMLKSTYKFLWVRFLVNGQKQDLQNNQNKYFNRMDYQDRNNWNKCIEATLIVSLDTNSILRVYRMKELLGSSSGDNIYTEVTPLYYVDLFNHNITAYDLSKCPFNGTFLTAIGIEPLDAQDLDNVDLDEINNTLNYIKNDTFHKTNINIKGKYKDLIGKSGFALLMIPLTDPNESNKENKDNNNQNNNNKENRYGREIENNEVYFGTDYIGEQMDNQGSNNLDDQINGFPKNWFNGVDDGFNEVDDGFNGFCCCDCLRSCTSTCVNICVYCGRKKYLENKNSSLNITHYEGNQDKELPLTPKSMFVWVSENSSEIEKFFVDCLPEFTFYEPTQFESYTPGIPTMHYGKFSSSIILPEFLGTGGASASDSVDFDKLFLNFVKDAHIQSPDVCFANTSANHISASDDGMVFLWSYQVEGFKSVQLTTKTMERWKTQTTNCSRSNENNKNEVKNTSFQNGNYDVSFEREQSSLKTKQKVSPLGLNYKSIYSKESSKKAGIDSENKDTLGNVSSNAIYMVVELSWSAHDKYVCVADSVVTKHNYRKAITQARTICSGLSFFSSEGKRISDFLHDTLSYHVSCASFNPVCEEVCLAACYDGMIVIVDVICGVILNKMNFGPTSIWLDVSWHPMGHKFVACQKYGLFSMFSTDPKVLAERTPNYQSTYLDYYSNSLSYCNSAYSGPESNNVKLKRYYSSFSNAPITLNGDSTYEKVNRSLNGGPVVFLDEHKNNVVLHTSGGVKRCRLVSYLPNKMSKSTSCDSTKSNYSSSDYSLQSDNTNNNKENRYGRERENNEIYFGTDYLTHSFYLAMCKINGFREYFEGHYVEDENGDAVKIMKQFIRLMEILNKDNNNKDKDNNKNKEKENKRKVMNNMNGMIKSVDYQKNQEDSLQEISDYRCYLGECTLCESYLTLNEQHSKYLGVKDNFVQLKSFTDNNGLVLRALPPSARPQDLLGSLDADQTATPVRRIDTSSYLNTCSTRSNRIIVSSSSEEPLVGVGLVLPTNMFSDSNILDNSVTFDSDSELGNVNRYERNRILSDNYAYDLRNRTGLYAVELEEDEDEFDDEFELGHEGEDEEEEDSEVTEEELDGEDELASGCYTRRSSRLANARKIESQEREEYDNEGNEDESTGTSTLRVLRSGRVREEKNNISREKRKENKEEKNKEDKEKDKEEIERRVRTIQSSVSSQSREHRERSESNVDEMGRVSRERNVEREYNVKREYEIENRRIKRIEDNKDKDNNKEKEKENNKNTENRDKEDNNNQENIRVKRENYSYESKKLVESAKSMSMKIGPLKVNYKGNEGHLEYLSKTCIFCGLGEGKYCSKLTRDQTQKFSNTIFSRGDDFNPVSKLFENKIVGPIVIQNKYYDELCDYKELFKRLEGSCEIYSHVSCLMTSEVKVDSGNKLVNLLEVLVRSSLEECKYCEYKFASICCVRCGSWFHYPCSIAQYVGYRKEAKGSEILNQYDPVICEEYICVDCGVRYKRGYLTSSVFLESESRKWLMNEYDQFENNFNIQVGDWLVMTEESVYGRINTHVRWITQKEYPVVVKVVDMDYAFYDDSNVVGCLLVESVFGEFGKFCVFVTEKTRFVLLRDYLASFCLLSKIQEGTKVRCKVEGVVYNTEVKKLKIDVSAEDKLVDKTKDTQEVFDMEFMKKTVKDLYSGGHNTVNVLVDKRPQWVSLWDLECDQDLLNESKAQSFLESDKQLLLDILGEKKIEMFYSIEEFKQGSKNLNWISEYWKLIARPIGIKEIKEKIFNGYYRSPYGVIGDLKLVVSNCFKFNSFFSVYAKTARHLDSALDKAKQNFISEEEWSVILPLMCPKIKESLTNYLKNKEKSKNIDKNIEKNIEKIEIKPKVEQEEVCLEDESSKVTKRRSPRIENLEKEKRKSPRLPNNVDKSKKEFKNRKRSRYNFR